MTDEFRQFLISYEPLTDDEVAIIAGKLKSKRLKRGEYLLREGEVCRDFIFVQKGLLRYYLPTDIELTVWIAFPNNFGSEVQSFLSGQPSRFYIQAIEDAELYYLPKPVLLSLYDTIPALQSLVRKMWEEGIVSIIDRMVSLQADPAPKRYLDLLNDPDYLQMIPQKYLASYLGVTASSLSRIRRQLKDVR